MEFWDDVQVKIKTVAENTKAEAERLSNLAKIKLNISDLKLKRRASAVHPARKSSFIRQRQAIMKKTKKVQYNK